MMKYSLISADRPRLLGATAALLCVPAMLTGCTDPYASQIGTTTTSSPASQPVPPVTSAEPATEADQGSSTTPPTLPAAPAHGQGSALGVTPDAALTRFANLYINWTAKTVGDRLERLSRLTVGDAAVTLARTAERSRQDKNLQTVDAYNRGTVASVAPKADGKDTYVVVTYEESGAEGGKYEGLPPTYRVILAQVEQVEGGWTVSSWEPQS